MGVVGKERADRSAIAASMSRGQPADRAAFIRAFIEAGEARTFN